ncbi:phosphodiesterase [Gloeobacter kilaueensis]|uniref:Cyclic 3',5'-adenosine monophosphate phosphodiesterase n=1 Tax=Gloeobacter kilaueensis (strain ATCC BAA-2537 / CCAP 1431/1 / ULC 316 / JS1) TaxID=1183438 RepID=U5QJ47_GLOK1|nr:phosphodiesterase [Gloeobacter kilaueensis]AGY57705.1 cyclic 3',5'-adenosine monophosphate phosphodiesterase [Gloeobacter kilaueensis JS1]
MPELTIAQISDTHLLSSPQEYLRGYPVHASLQAVLGRLAEEKPDLLLVTGDVAEAGEMAAYGQLAELVAPLGLPTAWLSGNHDDPAAMRAVLDRPPFIGLQQIDCDPWRILLIDSVQPDSRYGEGYLSSASLEQLDAALHACRDRHVLLALHHHPLPTGVDWLDTIGLTNAADLFFVLDRHPCLRLVLYGHVHLEQHHRRNGVDYYACPSTALQVVPPGAPITASQPGFRLLTLFDDGTHWTQVPRLIG